MDITTINNARRYSEAVEDEKAEQAQRLRVAEAALDLKKQSREQIDVLRAQLSESQKANELLVRQAEDAKRFAEKADNRSIISIGIAGTSLLVAVISLIKGC